MTDPVHRPRPPNIRVLGSAQQPVRTPEPLPDPPPCPEWMSAEARAEWSRLAPLLAVTWEDRYSDVLAAYCVLFAEFKADPSAFTAPKLCQMRLLMGELALGPRSAAALRLQQRPGR